MNTPMPPEAPRVYARSQFGPRTMKYMRDKKWIDRRTVVPRERAAEEIEERIARLKETK